METSQIIGPCIAMAVLGLTNISCFLLGAKVGQTVSRGETIQLPKPNPIRTVQNPFAKSRADKEQERIAAILQNIENYDGTPAGQRDVP